MPHAIRRSRRLCRKRLILRIGDHRQGLHSRRLILEDAGYEVITASSGRIGLRLLGQHPVQLVILDYGMPEMNGESVAREIRRRHPHVRILMLSGHVDIPEGASAAVDAFVAKGQPPAVLLEELTALAFGQTRRVTTQ